MDVFLAWSLSDVTIKITPLILNCHLFTVGSTVIDFLFMPPAELIREAFILLFAAVKAVECVQ